MPTAAAIENQATLLSAGQNNKGRQQGSNGAAGVAADLKERLGKPMLSARGDACDARRFGMKDGRSGAYHGSGHQQHGEGGREGQHYDAREREAHANGECVRHGTPIGVKPDQGL